MRNPRLAAFGLIVHPVNEALRDDPGKAVRAVAVGIEGEGGSRAAAVAVREGDAENPLVNFAMSTAILVGAPLVFLSTAPCGMLLKCRYSSSRV